MKLGEWNLLRVDRMKEVGAYLTDGTEDVLLPRKQVPRDVETGDNLQVFLYKDSQDRLIATVHTPLITVGEMKRLKCKSVSSFGAFLDMGLERDLFLPMGEQTTKVQQEKSYLVQMYVDRSQRLAATMRLTNLLKPLPEGLYQKGDHVTGTVVELKSKMGAFVAIDDCYEGLIHTSEIFDTLQVGDLVNCRVVKVREDGKTDLSMREEIPQQMEKDAEMVYDIIRSYQGVLPFNDRADAAVIRREFGISRNAFKRAVGHLLKEKKIRITDTTIELTEDQT